MNVLSPMISLIDKCSLDRRKPTLEISLAEFRLLSPRMETLTSLSLSWANFCGPFDINTPLVVLTEVFRSRGIETSEEEILEGHEECLDLCNDSDVNVIANPPVLEEDIIVAGRFFTTRNTLTCKEIKGFLDRFCLLYDEIEQSSKEELFARVQKSEIGYLDENKLPLPMLYHIARKLEIPMMASYSIEKIQTRILLESSLFTPFLESDNTTFLRQLAPFLTKEKKEMRCAILAALDVPWKKLLENKVKSYQLVESGANTIDPIEVVPKTPPKPVTEDFPLKYSDISRIRSSSILISRTRLLTNQEAIWFAARNLLIDITYSDDPLATINFLQEQFRKVPNHDTDLEKSISRSIVAMIANDPKLKKIHSYNHYLLDLRFTFNPKLPYNCYLNNFPELALREGLIDSSKPIDYEKIYQDMCEITTEPNFYVGRQLLTEEETLNFENILKVDEKGQMFSNTEIISYGILSGNVPFKVMTVTEIVNYFAITRSLTNPFVPKQPLDRRSRTRLTNLSKRIGDIIRTLMQEEIDGKASIKSFQETFLKYDISQQISIQKLLKRILKLGMIMRGWNENDDYPLSKAGSLTIEEIEQRVSESLPAILEDSSYNHIRNCRLFAHQNGEYVVSNLSQVGTTLHERFLIILENKSDDSCLKVSSNWLISTAFQLLETTKKRQKFSLASMKFLLE